MNIRRAIVCEKNKEIASDISSALQVAFPNCDLIVTDLGVQCIKMAQVKLPDIFILGLDITDMCGFELIKSIRRLYDNYIVVLSNTGNDEELIKTMKQGADQYIKKESWNLDLIVKIRNF